MGERLFHVVEGPDLVRPKLGSARLVDVFTLSKKSYDRPRIWTAALDPDLPRAHGFAFDLEGRVAGLLEPLPDAPSLAALLAGEWVGSLVKSGWVEALRKLGAVEQLAQEYRAQPDAYEAEALCAIGLALHNLGDSEGAIGAWERASAKDPLNPWPHHALGALPMRDESTEDEALTHFFRATELEAEEPAVADETPPSV
jgi:tetratricopeptide (TPR) repeat protein